MQAEHSAYHQHFGQQHGRETGNNLFMAAIGIVATALTTASCHTLGCRMWSKYG
jgi:hypothetical protein